MNIAGFYLPPRHAKKDDKPSTEETKEAVEEELADNLEKNLDLNNNSLNEEDAEDNDETGWITPGNLEEVKKLSNLTGDEQEIETMQVTVGCMTSDFSMQVIN